MIIAVINQKGGSGKTTSVSAIGAALAQKEKRTLLVDIDAQAHLTYSLGISLEIGQPSMFELLREDALSCQEIMMPRLEPYLYILPASATLSGAEAGLAGIPGQAYWANGQSSPIPPVPEP